MRLSVRLLGCEVFAVDTTDPCDHRPQLEATAGGQFEFGFTTDDQTVSAGGVRIGRTAGYPAEEQPDHGR